VRQAKPKAQPRKGSRSDLALLWTVGRFVAAFWLLLAAFQKRSFLEGGINVKYRAIVDFPCELMSQHF
jgi:hypothetical protein